MYEHKMKYVLKKLKINLQILTLFVFFKSESIIKELDEY